MRGAISLGMMIVKARHGTSISTTDVSALQLVLSRTMAALLQFGVTVPCVYAYVHGTFMELTLCPNQFYPRNSHPNAQKSRGAVTLH